MSTDLGHILSIHLIQWSSPSPRLKSTYFYDNVLSTTSGTVVVEFNDDPDLRGWILLRCLRPRLAFPVSSGIGMGSGDNDLLERLFECTLVRDEEPLEVCV